MKLSELITFIILISCLALLVRITAQNDTKLNNTWDKCQTRFEKSGAPMEARDGMMRACFSE
jgi:hypothetical protein